MKFKKKDANMNQWAQLTPVFILEVHLDELQPAGPCFQEPFLQKSDKQRRMGRLLAAGRPVT